MRVLIAIAFILSMLVPLVTISASAQTAPAQTAPPQTPSTAPVQNQPPPLAPASATTNVNAVRGPAAATTTVTTPVTSVGNESSSSLGKSFGSAGNGLPGMPGGSPVNTTPGARDPSAQYMRPPVLPPVLCDPAIDLPC
jgi:hypothetical protein